MVSITIDNLLQYIHLFICANVQLFLLIFGFPFLPLQKYRSRKTSKPKSHCLTNCNIGNNTNLTIQQKEKELEKQDGV
jgi:hypothetical protein